MSVASNGNGPPTVRSPAPVKHTHIHQSIKMNSRLLRIVSFGISVNKRSPPLSCQNLKLINMINFVWAFASAAKSHERFGHNSTDQPNFPVNAVWKSQNDACAPPPTLTMRFGFTWAKVFSLSRNQNKWRRIASNTMIPFPIQRSKISYWVKFFIFFSFFDRKIPRAAVLAHFFLLFSSICAQLTDSCISFNSFI